MRKSTFALVVTSSLACLVPVNVLATCDTGVNPTAVSGSVLDGKLVCASKGAGGPNERWSEMHFAPGATGGTLGEWGRGSDDPAGSYDAAVGTWQYTGNTITYNYDSTYQWTLFGPDANTPKVFCDGTTLVATIKQANNIPITTTLTNPCGW